MQTLTSGWKPSAVTILQSGNPFTVLRDGCLSSGGDYTKSPTTAGDYNADGTNYDVPDIPTYGYNIPSDRNSQLGRNADHTSNTNRAGYFGAATDFALPKALPGQGNEQFNRYRNPGMPTQIFLQKTTKIHEQMNLQLQLEIYNLFNRANLGAITSIMNSATFGKVTSSIPLAFCSWGEV